MASTTMIHVRIDEKIKKEAAETLENMGLSVSDAVRVFLKRVVADKQLPFELKVPNATTRQAMEEADEIVHSKRARYQDGSEFIGTLKRPPDSKRTTLPRSSDFTKDFLKDWKRLVPFRPIRHDSSHGSYVVVDLQQRSPCHRWKDHRLEGDWKGFRECHIGGDFLLVYKLDNEGNSGTVIFGRTETHSELFK